MHLGDPLQGFRCRVVAHLIQQFERFIQVGDGAIAEQRFPEVSGLQMASRSTPQISDAFQADCFKLQLTLGQRSQLRQRGRVLFFSDEQLDRTLLQAPCARFVIRHVQSFIQRRQHAQEDCRIVSIAEGRLKLLNPRGIFEEAEATIGMFERYIDRAIPKVEDAFVQL